MKRFPANWIRCSFRIPAYTVFCFFLFSLTLQAQYSEVSGIITDADDGLGLPGVNILVVSNSETIGTISDFDGTFNLKAAKGDVLEFSYLGYATQQITLGNSATLTVRLVTEAATLDEVVVIGYGAVVKKDLTGGVTKITNEDFNDGVINSPESLITGKVAGLQISNNGEPGGAFKLRLRGGTSLDASSDPLIVIDGVPMDNRGNASGRNPLNFMNASDVADITVLKDASAAAIYGSRGANGVIIITTKRGKKGKMKVNYNGSYSLAFLGNNPKILDAPTFRAAIDSKAPQFLSKLGDANTDWVDEITQQATGLNNTLNLSGGLGNNTTYYLSGAYNDNQGVIKTSQNNTKSIGANVSTKLLDNNLIVNLRSKTGFTEDRFSPGVIGSALAFDPTQSPLDENSPYGGYYQWSDILATKNPVSSLNLTTHIGNLTRSQNNIDVEYKMPFLKGLSLKTNLSYDKTTGEKYNLQSPLLRNGANVENGGYLFLENENHYSKLIETYGVYKTELPSLDSKVEFTAGHSWQESDRENRWTQGVRLQEDNSESGYIYTEDISRDSFLVTNRLASFFGRMNYNLSEKYLLTFSLRADGSSRFGAGNKWGYFPATAFAWRILEEDFASGLQGALSNLKLRLSYGVTGNEDIQDFLFSVFYGLGTDDARYQFGDEYVNTLRGVGVDPGIKWESTRSYNIGLDFGMFDNRLTGSIDAYNKVTDDLLFRVAAGAFTNLSDRIVTNIGEMNNKGLEFSINSVLVDGNKFNWDLGFNFAVNRNKIVKLDNSNDPNFGGYETGGISGDIGQTIQVLKVGESINSFRTYKHIRDSNGNPLQDNEDHNNDGVASPLDIYEDINGDGLINENDLVITKNGEPKLTLGLTTSMNYGNIDFGFTLRSILGHTIYNNNASSTGYFDRLSDRVPNNIHTSAFKTNFKERQLKSDYYLEDGSFVKLDNVTLGYSIKSIKFVKNVRFYFTGQNLLTLTGYSGLDPEIPLFSGGIDNNPFPVSRNFIFGLNANF